MGLLTGLFEKRSVSIAKEFLRPGAGGVQTNTGIAVTETRSLRYSAVFRAVDLLSRHIAMLPMHLYERTGAQAKARAVAHPLYALLHDAPNEEMSAYTYRDILMKNLLLWGNHYAEIEWDRSGFPAALWPLRPDWMQVKREGGGLVYRYDQPGAEVKSFSPYQIFHVLGFTLNGVSGVSVIRYAREAIGLGMAAEEFGARFFGNDARPGVILQHPGVLGDGAHERLRKSWESRHQGLDKSHRVGILEEGMDFKEIGIPPEDAQFLETREFQITDVARWFGVPPHKLMQLQRSTFSNIEHQAIEYVQDSLQPWATNLERAVDRQLLLASERGRLYSKLSLDALLRGDSESRHTAYGSGIQNGYFSVNDVRRLEDLDPVEGGDQHFRPLNMVELNSRPAAVEEAAPAADSARARLAAYRHLMAPVPAALETRALRSGVNRHRIMQDYRPVYADVLARILRREANDVGNKARQLLGDGPAAAFDTWLDEFYQEHEGFVARNMEPAAAAYARQVAREAADEAGSAAPDDEDLAAFVAAYLRTFAARHANFQASRVRRKLAQDEPLAALEEELETWRNDERAESIALDETGRANNAVAIFVYGLAGIAFKTWLAFGESCPYCTNLNGRKVGLTVNFLNAGEEFAPGGAAPLAPSHNIGHPPAHRGCDCMIVSG